MVFITIEGGEGSGKTSSVEFIANWMNQHEYPCIQTRNPGGTDIGAKIRSILLDPENVGISRETELLLYTADRAQHLNEVVIPAIRNGISIVCDRFVDCTVVYQGIVRGIPADTIYDAHNYICQDYGAPIFPDITFILDVDPETGLRRALHDKSRSKSEARFELEKLEFHKAVRAGYLKLPNVGRVRDRFHIIDASLSREEVLEQIFSVLSSKLLRKAA